MERGEYLNLAPRIFHPFSQFSLAHGLQASSLFFSLFFDKQRDPRENARASSGGKEELATKGFSFLLHPVETKYYWLENDTPSINIG